MPIANALTFSELSVEALLNRLAADLPSFVPLTLQDDPATSCDRPGFQPLWAGRSLGLDAVVRIADAGERQALLVEFRQRDPSETVSPVLPPPAPALAVMPAFSRLTLPGFTVEYWQDGARYVGRISETPDIVSQGKTLAELVKNLHAAWLLTDLTVPTEAGPAEDPHGAIRERPHKPHEPLRAVTIRVVERSGLSERAERRFQRGVRLADSWRFKPGRRSPLEEMRDRRRRKGGRETADALQAELGGLPPEVRERLRRRETIWWRTVLLDQRQRVEDVRFLLALTLLQEDMVPSCELEPMAVNYIRAHVRGGCSDGIAYLVLQDLRRHFTEPEDWRAVLRYIRRTARGKMDDRPGIHETDSRVRPRRRRAVAHDVDQPGEDSDPLQARLMKHKRRHSKPQFADLVSVADAAARLPISRDTLYDWINSGKIPLRFGEGDRRVLDVAGLDRVRELLRKRELREKIRAHLRRHGKTVAAAKKFLYRRLKAGATVEDVFREISAKTTGATADHRRGAWLHSR